MKKQADQWLTFANYDLVTITEIIENELLTATVAFHAQQCIEKSLKAILSFHDLKIPRIHDLRKLYSTVSDTEKNLLIDSDLIDQLNQVYIDTRYPADFGLMPEGKPSITKANEFHKLARDVYDRVVELINSNSE